MGSKIQGEHALLPSCHETIQGSSSPVDPALWRQIEKPLVASDSTLDCKFGLKILRFYFNFNLRDHLNFDLILNGRSQVHTGHSDDFESREKPDGF